MGDVIRMPARRLAKPPRRQTTYGDRSSTPRRYGSLVADELESVLVDLSTGKLERWSDLCDWMLDDVAAMHVHETRCTRVAQADYMVVPAEVGAERKQLAQEAASFLGDYVSRIPEFNRLIMAMMDAVGRGTSCNQLTHERETSTGIVWLEDHEYIPLRRFAYSRNTGWDIRLVRNHGRSVYGTDGYGEALQPQLWIVHQHSVRAGTPDKLGVLRTVALDWMFLRWHLKGWVTFTETYGHPIATATVNPNAPDEVRDRILAALENYTYEHRMVMEEGDKVEFQEAGTSGGTDVHQRPVEFFQRRIELAYNGSSEASNAQANGNRSAIETKLGVTMDPRMVADGLRINDTFKRTLFRYALQMNEHVFGDWSWRQIPMPDLRFKTADDEVVKDEGDAASERVDDAAAPNESLGEVRSEPQQQPKPSAQPTQSQPEPTPVQPIAADVQKQALNGAQVDSLKGLLTDVANGVIPPDTARALIPVAFPAIDSSAVDAMLAPIIPRPPAPPAPAEPTLPATASREPAVNIVVRPRKATAQSPLARAMKGKL